MPNQPHTGEQLAVRDPDKYEAIVRDLAQGKSAKSIADHRNTSQNTVRHIRNSHPELIAKQKVILARKFSDVAIMSAEAAIERLEDPNEKIPFNQLLVAGGIATDKALLLAGEATERIEHVVKVDDDEFDKILRDAKKAEVIDIAEDTDSADVSIHSDERMGSTGTETFKVDEDISITAAGAGTKEGGRSHEENQQQQGDP